MHSSVGSASTFAASAASMSAGTTVACVTPRGLSSLHVWGEKSGSGTRAAPTPRATRRTPAPAWWVHVELASGRREVIGHDGDRKVGPGTHLLRHRARLRRGDDHGRLQIE